MRFDELAFREDLGRATARGREVAVEARERLEREGADPSELLRCQAEHREGTELPNCVKVCLPGPDGQWGMVFEFVRERPSGKLLLSYLGLRRTPPQPSSAARRLPARARTTALIDPLKPGPG